MEQKRARQPGAPAAPAATFRVGRRQVATRTIRPAGAVMEFELSMPVNASTHSGEAASLHRLASHWSMDPLAEHQLCCYFWLPLEKKEPLDCAVPNRLHDLGRERIARMPSMKAMMRVAVQSWTGVPSLKRRRVAGGKGRVLCLHTIIVVTTSLAVRKLD